MTYMATVDVTIVEWERRKAFAGFTAEDERLLADLSNLVEGFVDEAVDDLYA